MWIYEGRGARFTSDQERGRVTPGNAIDHQDRLYRSALVSSPALVGCSADLVLGPGLRGAFYHQP